MPATLVIIRNGLYATWFGEWSSDLLRAAKFTDLDEAIKEAAEMGGQVIPLDS